MRVIVHTGAKTFEVIDPGAGHPADAVTRVWDAITHGRPLRCRLERGGDFERQVIFSAASVHYVSTTEEQ